MFAMDSNLLSGFSRRQPLLLSGGLAGVYIPGFGFRPLTVRPVGVPLAQSGAGRGKLRTFQALKTLKLMSYLSEPNAGS